MNKHLETLKAYQAWRRDDTEEPRTLSEMGLSAMAIGHALDWAIAELSERPSETQSLAEVRAEAVESAREFASGEVSSDELAEEYDMALCEFIYKLKAGQEAE